MRAFSSFRVALSIVCCSRCRCSSFVGTNRRVLGRRPSNMLLTPAVPRVATEFASGLRRQRVPCVFVSSGITDLGPLTFFKRGSSRDKCFTTHVTVVLKRYPGRVIVFERVGRNHLKSGRRRGHRGKFEGCVRRRFPSYGVIRLGLCTGHPSRSRTLVGHFFRRGPRIAYNVAFGSGICVVKRCLVKRGVGGFGLVKCSLLRQGISYLGRNTISFLVTRRPATRKCDNMRDLYGRLVFGGRIGRYGCVPVALLTIRGISFCLSTRGGWV